MQTSTKRNTTHNVEFRQSSCPGIIICFQLQNQYLGVLNFIDINVKILANTVNLIIFSKSVSHNYQHLLCFSNLIFHGSSK